MVDSILEFVDRVIVTVVCLVVLPFYFLCKAIGVFAYSLYIGFVEGWTNFYYIGKRMKVRATVTITAEYVVNQRDYDWLNYKIGDRAAEMTILECEKKKIRKLNLPNLLFKLRGAEVEVDVEKVEESYENQSSS